jgi:ABC-type lipoprotein export system ATPase subunit
MSQLAEQETKLHADDSEEILRVRGLQKAFRIGDSEVQILKGLDFSLKAGEFVAIEGRSGSGKSTLLHILGALESVDGGSTEFDSVDYSARSPREQNWWRPGSWLLGRWMRIETVVLLEALVAGVVGWFLRDQYGWAKWLFWVSVPQALVVAIALILTAIIHEKRERPRADVRNRKFGFVFQFYHLLPELNAVQNTMLAVMIKYSSLGFMAKRAEIQKRAVSLLTELGLAHRLKHRSSHLSGGERQRVAIARALMNNPQILFADEPTGNLDAETGRQIMDVLEKLHREQGQTIVMVTHDRTLAREADRVLVLKDGKLEPAV